MSTDRAKLYDRVARALAKWTDADPVRETYIASTPDGPEDVPGIGTLGLAAMKLVRELEAVIPFERHAAAGLWETLLVTKADGRVWLSVANAIGRRDMVTTWGTARGYGAIVEAWCACREESVPGDTAWDEARRERRVVDWMGGPTVIDRGANRIIDLVRATGAETTFSCEGHPNGAYLGFVGGDADTLGEAFEEAGWEVERSRSKTVVRMPAVGSVAERDADWRRTCEIVEAKLDLRAAATLR